MAPKLRAGKGAKAKVLTRFVNPKQQKRDDKDHRSEVVIVGEFDDEKGKRCYQLVFADNPLGGEFYANARYVKVTEEGDPDCIFDLGEGESAGQIRWADSAARRLLYQDIIDEVVPLEAKDEEGNLLMSLEEIYSMRPEYLAFDFGKFGARLSYIRQSIKKEDNRAEADEEAFDIFVAHHDVSFHSHKGYVQWKGSEAQALALRDIANGVHDLTKKGGRNKEGGFRALYNSRPQYYEAFPFPAFSEKIRQEIKTKKYLHTLKVKGKLHKSS